jgi:hypothetical protein
MMDSERSNRLAVFLELLQENIDRVEWMSREHEEQGSASIRQRWLEKWAEATAKDEGDDAKR